MISSTQFPFADIIIIIMLLLIGILIVNIMCLHVLKSFLPKQEEKPVKKNMPDLHLKDLR